MFLTWWLKGLVIASIGPWTNPTGCTDAVAQANQEFVTKFHQTHPVGAFINNQIVRASDFKVTCEQEKKP